MERKMQSRNLSTAVAAGLAASLGLVGTLKAQDSRPVPAYADYMNGCVKGAQPQGGYGSSVEKAFEEANCQCKFEHLPKGTMTKEQFFSAASVCQKEKSRGAKLFTEKYYARISRGPQAPQTPENAGSENATFKYGSGTIFLGPDCVATSTQFGRGKWGWANGGVMVDLEKKKNIGFARAESPYQDDRCRL